MEINVVVVTPVIGGQLCFRGNQMNAPCKWVFEISIRSNRIYLLHNVVLISMEKMISYVLKEASNVKLDKQNICYAYNSDYFIFFSILLTDFLMIEKYSLIGNKPMKATGFRLLRVSVRFL